jgi:hypothetical protein
VLDFFIDNIFVLFGGWVFQQTIGISMGTNCAPLLADLFLHAYEADFLQGVFKNKDRKLAQNSNSSFHYSDDVLSLNNTRFGDYLHHIYPNELEVKGTTDTQKFAVSATGAWGMDFVSSSPFSLLPPPPFFKIFI